MKDINLFKFHGKRMAGAIALSLLSVAGANAQRLQHLGRGVVATYSSNTGVLVSWRRLIQDPEDARYNIYVAKNGVSYSKINSSPLKLTNYKTTTSIIPNGSKVYVTMVDSKGKEGEPSVPFTYNQVNLNGTIINGGYFSVNYQQAGSPIVNSTSASFNTKYCWPVDLDGDGEMEYVINRIYTGKDQNGCEGWGDDKLGGDCLEAYTREGKHLWTVNLGIHFYAFGGQNDGVSVGDFDGDGKGEVMVQVCEGARFWDSANNTFGKYLYYNGTQASASGSGTVTVSSNGSSADIDKDGVTNYTYYSKGKNPQWYFAVIDGMTGAQKDVCAMTLPDDGDMQYTRINKSAFMNDEYSYLSPAMGAAYLDGKTQSAVAQFQCRTTDGNHHYFTYAYGYKNGKFSELWRFNFHNNGNPSEFHHIRIGDVDGDGKDEVMNGACAVDHDGKLLWNSGIGHGDRFRLSDIDPDHPGQEIFAIQQNAGDMLGQILYDATTGKAIKKWYLSAVGDVGRGECMDVDSLHKGYEMWSTMPNMYDAHGDFLSTDKPYPTEGIWWDGDLGREALITTGSGNNCPAVVAKCVNGGWSRLYQISSLSGWQLVCENAVRPMFWGDITGDWREELILKIHSGDDELGFCCLSTDYTTSVDNVYCLLQDPNYFGQITNRGYYQSPNTSFYLGYDMPRPQLPPFVQADDNNEVFDLTLGNATVTPSADKENVFFMPVKNQTLTVDNEISGSMNIWKSQPGTTVLNKNINTTGKTIVSDGTLVVNGEISGALELRAKGTVSGVGTIDNISFEGALNYEGGRILPTPVMQIKKDVNFDKNAYIELTLANSAMLKVGGNISVTAPVVFTITDTEVSPGEYTLIQYEGSFSGLVSQFSINGLKGISYNIVNEENENAANRIKLVVNAQRDPSENVHWTAAQSKEWDYQTDNWSLNDETTSFVANDGVVFGDLSASSCTVDIPELMPTSKVEVDNSTTTYTFSGDGGLSGTGMLVKNGAGKLVLNTVKSDYTGATVINAGTVTVKDLADGCNVSSIGAAKSDISNFRIGKATLVIDNTNTSTDRGITLTDTATISIASGTAAFKGMIAGTGVLKKTGNGQINITYPGATSWSGTILQAGVLAMGAWNTTFGKATSPIHVTGNSTITMFDNNSSSAVPSVQNIITIDAKRVLTFNAGSRCQVKGSLLGTGTYKISFPYVRGDVYTNLSKFEGTYEVASGGLRLRQAIDLSKGTFQLDAGTSATGYSSDKTEASYSHKIGALVSTATDCTLSTGTWNVGYLGTNTTYAGLFNANAVINKYGDGILTLTGASAGSINIYAGEIEAKNTTSAITTGLITVRNGGLLDGTGKVQNVTVMSGGTIGAAKSTSVINGTLNVLGNLLMNSGSILRVRVRSTAASSRCDAFNVTGTTKLTSPKILISETSDYPIVDDAALKIFTGTGSITITGDVTIEPAQPKAGYLWDTSTLAEDGTLRIKADPNAINEVNADDIDADAEIYDMTGRRVTVITRSGMYIVNGKKEKVVK